MENAMPSVVKVLAYSSTTFLVAFAAMVVVFRLVT